MQTIKIICDKRENPSQVISELNNISSKDFNLDITLEVLSVGDYQLSSNVVIERKTISDLEQSIIDGRIFSQIRQLVDVPKPGIIIEGSFEILKNHTRINRKAIIGLITSIGLTYKIPVFFTKNQKETAEFLYIIAKKEQFNKNSDMKIRYSKYKMTDKERQLFIIESFPDIGPKLAKSILKEFKSIKNVADAKIEDLLKIPQLGPKKAKRLKELFEREFL
jgi:ERCC4-type nuclease